jgi:iron(III) transport system permease protein
LANTLSLLLATVFISSILGVGAAWLVEWTNLPGRQIWRILLALPLAIPAYVVALCYVLLLRRGGILERIALQFSGIERGELWLPAPYGRTGAAVIISLCIFPYIYLPVSAALRAFDQSFDEAARIAGRNGWQRFRLVVLPLILPALVGGALLVALYVLSDFGTVAMLRYRTFTTAIYNEFTGAIDRSGAAILSLTLIVLAAPLLWIEGAFSRRSVRMTSDVAWRPHRLLELGGWRWVGLAMISGLTAASLGAPLLVLGGLSLQGWLFPSEVDRIWSLNNLGIFRFGLNSLWLASLSATLTTAIAVAPTYLAVRFPGRMAAFLLNLCKSPFALPGVIAGLAFVLLLNRWAPILYGTAAALLFGFVFRLLPQSITSTESALRSVAPSLEEAARTMGFSSAATLQRVTLPIAAPGIIASWALVFITAMKELPTAILLRPPGMDTLSVRIWAAASESVHTQAAMPAFLLIVLTMLVMLLLLRSRAGLEKVLHENG